VLLPVGDDADASAEAEAALREHERLDEVRGATLTLLREVLCDALGGAADDRQLVAGYERAAAAKRLAGVLPDGLFGDAMRERHLALLHCWRAALVEAAVPPGTPAPIWLGAAPEHRRDAVIRSPLDLPRADGTTVLVGGRTELVVPASGDGPRVVLVLHRSTSQDKLDRDFLGPFFTHLALAVLEDDDRPTRALVVRPAARDGSPSFAERSFNPVTAADARAYLGALADELLHDVHAYFLPCEGVFHFHENAAKGKGVRESVLYLRDDNWTKFNSEHGPIPDPKEYPVPSEELARAMVARRFQRYFEAAGPDAAEPRSPR
jgi:hypothetical protein